MEQGAAAAAGEVHGHAHQGGSAVEADVGWVDNLRRWQWAHGRRMAQAHGRALAVAVSRTKKRNTREMQHPGMQQLLPVLTNWLSWKRASCRVSGTTIIVGQGSLREASQKECRRTPAGKGGGWGMGGGGGGWGGEGA